MELFRDSTPLMIAGSLFFPLIAVGSRIESSPTPMAATVTADPNTTPTAIVSAVPTSSTPTVPAVIIRLPEALPFAPDVTALPYRGCEERNQIDLDNDETPDELEYRVIDIDGNVVAGGWSLSGYTGQYIQIFEGGLLRRRLQFTGPRGSDQSESTYLYDEFDRLIELVSINRRNESVIYRRRYVYDDSAGLGESISWNADGEVSSHTEFEFIDGLIAIERSFDPQSGSVLLLKYWRWEDERLIRIDLDGGGDGVIDTTETLEYDAIGRFVRRLTDVSADGSIDSIDSIERSPAGEIIAVLSMSSGAEETRSEWEYESSGRILERRDFVHGQLTRINRLSYICP